MLERTIFTALTRGIDYLIAHPRRLNRFFRGLGLSVAEADAIQTYFLAHRPQIQHSYPRLGEQALPPSFYIILGGENESHNFLSDDGGIIAPDEAEAYGELAAEITGAPLISSLYQHEYVILIITENPDHTLYYYQIARYALTHERAWMKSQGMLTIKFSGTDLAPDPRYLPPHLFVRKFMIDCHSDGTIIGDRPNARIARVDGIHVAGGSDTIIEEVQTNVTTFEPEES